MAFATPAAPVRTPVNQEALNKQLIEAVEAGNVRLVSSLLDQGAQINYAEWQPREQFRNPMLLACELGHSNIVRLFLERDADVNHIDVIYPSADTVDEALSVGLDALALSIQLGPDSRTPIIVAAKNGREDVVQILLDAGADYRLGRALWAAAFSANVNFSHVEVCRTLLSSGNLTEEEKAEAFIAASLSGDRDTAQLLLDSGVDVNCLAHSYSRAGDIAEQTALMFASEQGNAAVFNLLLQRNADVNRVDSLGATALMYLCWSDRQNLMMNPEYRLAMARSLIAEGININAQDAYGKTALDYATENGLTELAELLRSRGANLGSEL